MRVPSSIEVLQFASLDASYMSACKDLSSKCRKDAAMRSCFSDFKVTKDRVYVDAVTSARYVEMFWDATHALLDGIS